MNMMMMMMMTMTMMFLNDQAYDFRRFGHHWKINDLWRTRKKSQCTAEPQSNNTLVAETVGPLVTYRPIFWGDSTASREWLSVNLLLL